MQLLRKVQADSFPNEIKAFTSDKPVSASSRLSCLLPIYENVTGLIRIGGRLRRAVDLEHEMIHPILFDSHHASKLLIKQYDNNLFHSCPECEFAGLFPWNLKGKEAIRRH